MAKTLITEDNDGREIDALTYFQARWVKARNLKPGMILLDMIDDEGGCASHAIDHRNRAPQGSGSTVWFCQDFGTGRYEEVWLSPNKLVPVALEPEGEAA